MKTVGELMHKFRELQSTELQISFKAGDLEKERAEAARLLTELQVGLEEYERLRELAERVMTEHWDIGSCPCTFCVEGRKLGLFAKSRYPTNPKVSILDDGSKERQSPVYVWTETE